MPRGLGRIACTLLLSSSIAGCTQTPPEGAVDGEVTLDNQPLAQGNVQFIPESGEGATSGAEIKDGKFSAMVPVAKMRVQINANKIVGKRKVYDTPESPTVDVVQELIPPKYNVRTELSLDVQPGRQSPRFDLKSK